MNIWQEQTTLRFGSVDRSDRLTAAAVLGFFQEAAISHATILGVGRQAMIDSGQAWLLSRLSVFIQKRPKYGDTITIRTWTRGPEKLFCLRDYDISDSSGEILVQGRSGWLVINMEKRRPQRPDAIAEKLPLNEGMDALLSGPLGLAARENLAPAGERRAAYSDIDFNGHVNNVRYAQWIQDLCEPDLLDNADQMRLDINYLSEILPGDRVELLCAPIESEPTPEYPFRISSAFAFEGRRPASAEGQAVFRAELILGN